MADDDNIMNKIGTGTLTGAAIGGGLLAVLGSFFGGQSVQGSQGQPEQKFNLMQTLLFGALGVIGGGLAGGYIKGDGLFVPSDRGKPAPDGSPVVKRKVMLDAPPMAVDGKGNFKTTGEQMVELDYVATVLSNPDLKKHLDEIPDAAKMLDILQKNARIMVNTQAEAGKSDFQISSILLPGENKPQTFKRPVNIQQEGGKVDYLQAGALSFARYFEDNEQVMIAPIKKSAAGRDNMFAVLVPDGDKMRFGLGEMKDGKLNLNLAGAVDLRKVARSKIFAALSSEETTKKTEGKSPEERLAVILGQLSKEAPGGLKFASLFAPVSITIQSSEEGYKADFKDTQKKLRDAVGDTVGKLEQKTPTETLSTKPQNPAEKSLVSDAEVERIRAALDIPSSSGNSIPLKQVTQKPPGKQTGGGSVVL